MSDSVPLQDVVAKYRQTLDDVNYQLICHKVLVEQKDIEIRELKAQLEDQNRSEDETL